MTASSQSGERNVRTYRTAVRDGDRTTTRGRVVAHSSTIFDHGKHVALNGDRATCGSCEGSFSIFGTGKGLFGSGRDADRATGCLPNMKHLDAEVAHVCRPDTATHTIAINLPFCSLPERSAGNLSSQQLTIVHECAHFADTFGAGDHPGAYGRTACAQFARRYPDRAIGNADNIAWFILAR